MKIQYDVMYTFDLTDSIQFGNLPPDKLHTLFRDGRVSSKLLEHHIPLWFPELKYIDAHGYDYVDNTGKKKWDLKAFTKGGGTYIPSYMLGASRSINLLEVHAHAKTIDYVFSDIREFPIIHVQFRRGSELVKTFPTGKIKSRQYTELFNGAK